MDLASRDHTPAASAARPPRRSRGHRAYRALVVPDESAWAMWGYDLAATDLRWAASPEGAEILVLPATVPEQLAPAVLESWSRMPPGRRLVSWPAPIEGVPAQRLLQGGHDGSGHGDDGQHGATGEEHGAHSHEDMMAIVGEPSADGLVMEAIDFELGPLSPGLPGGLAVGLSLDGEVVAKSEPRATLRAPDAGATLAADPLAPCASGAATAPAPEAGPAGSEEWMRGLIAAIETERALSHLAWLRGFARLLGWEELRDCAEDALAPLVAPHAGLAAAPHTLGNDLRPALGTALAAALVDAERLRRRLEAGGLLRARTRARGIVPAARIEGSAIGGPVARASGIVRDARVGDPLYESLGFRPEVDSTGDAEARTLLRAAEADAALRLALAALSERGSPAAGGAPPGLAVEAPRGPLGAPGEEVLTLAGEAATGLELGSALVVLASFDLSPWAVTR